MVALQMQLSKPSMPCVHLENPFSPPSIRYTAAGTGTHALVSTRATGAVEMDRTMTFCVAFAATVFLVAGGCSRNPSPKPPTPPMGTFTLQCDPFGGLAEHQPIDDRCGPDGIGGANSLAQNRVKHSLCAAEPATAVDFATFQTLQADIPALGIAFGSPQMIPTPADRPKLRHPDTTHGIAVGEGSLVQFVGFVIEAPLQQCPRWRERQLRHPGRTHERHAHRHRPTVRCARVRVDHPPKSSRTSGRTPGRCSLR